MHRRLTDLRPITVGFLYLVASALTGFALVNGAPLGWGQTVAAAAGAVALFILPVVHHARFRSLIAGVAGFVIILFAEESWRNVPFPEGPAIAMLWLAALVGVVNVITREGDISVSSRLSQIEGPR